MQETQETWVRSLGGENPLGEEMETHSSILARTFHGQRSLVGYSPRGHKESDMAEHIHTHTHTHTHILVADHQASGVVAHGLCYLPACVTFQDQRLNPRPLHCKMNS